MELTTKIWRGFIDKFGLGMVKLHNDEKNAKLRNRFLISFSLSGFWQVWKKYYLAVVFAWIEAQNLEPQQIVFRYLHRQPLRQMKNSPKLAILQSLDTLDQVQMEKVLDYIKGVLQQPVTSNYQNFKKEAMKEIRKALRKNKKAEDLLFA